MDTRIVHITHFLKVLDVYSKSIAIFMFSIVVFNICCHMMLVNETIHVLKLLSFHLYVHVVFYYTLCMLLQNKFLDASMWFIYCNAYAKKSDIVILYKVQIYVAKCMNSKIVRILIPLTTSYWKKVQCYKLAFLDYWWADFAAARARSECIIVDLFIKSRREHRHSTQTVQGLMAPQPGCTSHC